MKYQPDYAVPPGEILAEYLESLGMSQAELSDRTGLAKKTINEIIKGKAPLTPETALKLERVLGRPAHFWNSLEQRYQEDLVRREEQERLTGDVAWLKRFPVRSMVGLGWISQHKDKVRQVEELLHFFGIAAPDRWPVVWEDVAREYGARGRVPSRAEAVSAWLRRGEIAALEIPCEPFSASLFRAMLRRLLSFSGDAPEVFLPKVIDLCRSAGVAVVFVSTLPKAGVHAATYWMDGKAVIQLNTGYRDNDTLWYALYHGAAHVLYDGRKDVFIEEKHRSDDREEEADRQACNLLIPVADYTDFAATRIPTTKDIRAFAAEVDIAPGIVVGMLQRDELLPLNHRNALKVRYKPGTLLQHSEIRR